MTCRRNKIDWNSRMQDRERFLMTVSADLVALGLPDRYRYRYRWTHRIAYYQRLLRLAEFRKGSSGLFSRFLYLWSRFRLELVGERMGFDIPLGVFGPGLSIAHRGTIVVNGNAQIGSGCRIHPGVTIGDVGGGAPIIEDDVFLGPNCGVFGQVVVGTGSMLGPHTLVRDSVPPASIVVANQGTVLDRKKGPWSNPMNKSVV